jgi:hypothetical protein
VNTLYFAQCSVRLSKRTAIISLCSATRLVLFNIRTVHIRSSRNNQHYALICTTPLFYVLSLTRFGSSLPSSGSFLDPSELLEIQIEWAVYHIMCGYVACVPECRGSDEYYSVVYKKFCSKLMIFVSSPIEKILIPCSYLLPFVPPNLLYTR